MQDIQAVTGEIVIRAPESEDESEPLVLTERDLAILRLVHDHRYLALNQIRRAFWKDCSDVAKAAYRRLTRLVKAGYLEVGHSRRKALDLYLLSDLALQELQRQGLDLGLARYNVKSARRRPGIPIEAGHLFRFKAATRSDGRRPLFGNCRNAPDDINGTI